MTERPILFQGAMVRALLAGTKTQTRRVLKPQPTNLAGPNFDGAWSDTRPPVVRYFACPYGRPGDRLWVKENFKVRPGGVDDLYVTYCADDSCAAFGAADGCVPDAGLVVYYRMFDRASKRMNDRKIPEIRPNIYLPRWACRLTLEIASVRVERLNDISEADALAEGCAIDRGNAYHVAGHEGDWAHATARGCYATLWASINGPGSWALNPWVWVVEFRRVTP